MPCSNVSLPSATAAARYSALCVGCHLAPRGDEVRSSRGPLPAPPAWGKSLDDAAIRDIVAFVRPMPTMSPDIYRLLADETSRCSAQFFGIDQPLFFCDKSLLIVVASWTRNVPSP
jgi:hypothetical protein